MIIPTLPAHSWATEESYNLEINTPDNMEFKIAKKTWCTKGHQVRKFKPMAAPNSTMELRATKADTENEDNK